FPVKFHVNRQLGLLDLAGDRRDDDRGTVLIADVILEDQNGPHAPLLRADDRAQVSVEDVAPPNLKWFAHTPGTAQGKLPIRSKIGPSSARVRLMRDISR